MRRIAEEALPRSAENIALAIGALCMVRLRSIAGIFFSTLSTLGSGLLFFISIASRISKDKWIKFLFFIKLGMHMTVDFDNINCRNQPRLLYVNIMLYRCARW